MHDPVSVLRERFSNALAAAFGDAGSVDPAIRRSQKADYQADVALQLARVLGKKPREVAEAIVAKLDLADVAETIEIAGPGFVNVTLSRAFLERCISAARDDERAGIPLADKPETVVVDYSSPNVAKEMHVGHLRSTIIGDALARTLELRGHTVVRQNHLGDWGTPFGMLIEHLVDEGADTAVAEVADLNAFYVEARKKFDAEPAFADRARARVVALQAGDVATLDLWRKLVDQSVRYFQVLYARLGVSLEPAHVRGESFFNPKLTGIVDALGEAKLSTENDGATCVFVPGFTNREGEPLPLIVQKQDGGFGYAATDLAAVRFRTGELGANRILYVVGASQQQHLSMVFEVAKKAGWLGEARAEHVAFGSILGPDRKMFKTRAGDNVRLRDLVDEAEDRANKAILEKNPDLAPEKRGLIARQIGVGAIKYADLSNDRIKDYVFDWDRMLAFEGNTGPYLMYAHARISSILRRVGEAGDTSRGAIAIEASHERVLAIELLELAGAVRAVETTLQPHRLCTQLHAIATAFTAFYEHCPVLRATSPEQRASRAALCDVTARALRVGLGLLGLEAPSEM